VIKPHYLLILFIALFSTSYGQSFTNERLSFIMSETKNIKAFRHTSANDLAFKITSKYNSQSEKASAIACWIIQNIKYNDLGYDEGENVVLTVEDILKKRKAHFAGLSLLYNNMCRTVGLSAESVPGYTRHSDFFVGDTLYRTNHMWSAVQFDDSWQLVDLMYAGTEKVQKKQLVSRLLNRTLNTSLTVKYKYQKKINPEWIFKHPVFMIRSHFPADYHMQMLSYPVSIETFCKGADEVKSYIEKNSINAVQNNYITNYSIKSQTEKYDYLSKETKKGNPRNNRDYGYIAYQTAAYMVEIAPLHNEEQHLMDSVTFAKFMNYLDINKSFIDKSIADNKAEYINYADRNDNWKFFIKGENKHLKFQMKKIKSSYEKRIKMVDKNKSKANKARTYVIIRKKSEPRNLIKHIERPEKNTAANNRASYLLIKKHEEQDSIYKATKLWLDSLIYANSIEQQHKLIGNEVTANYIIKKNNDYMKNLYKSGLLYRPLTYTELKPEKKEFAQNLNTIDSLNNDIADSLLFDQLRKLTDIYAGLAKLTAEYKSEQKLVEQIKKMSYDDNNEDSLYIENKIAYKNALTDYKRRINEYLLPAEEYKKVFRNNVRAINQSLLLLTQDDIGEKNRHIRYRTFRKGLKLTEDKRAKAIKNDCKALKDFVIMETGK